MLTSARRGEKLTRNPNKCNSTLTSGTAGKRYPHPYILMLMNGVTAYVFSTRADVMDKYCGTDYEYENGCAAVSNRHQILYQMNASRANQNAFRS